ncbi:hypothetical protein K469DRAFT_693772 [Zopfia rhizophila CBS 207.26]|uniref:Uncharacterized protein n=1 Tax=Zopfia rhizophila CBS 207.26 TaxID=1314779 RepID=A0A6A6DNC0_9PEZI|nr:hypothetical protein K469DRAFT_693772 [Zopfia rhizophila CBS 207.26]
MHIRLGEREVDVDIDTYVQHRLAASLIPVVDHISVKNAVPCRANGIFFSAKLAMDAFSQPSIDLQKVLLQLPADLNILYTSVTRATRTLGPLDIADMINITQCSQQKWNLKATKDLVCSACGLLLEMLPDETVCVVHRSLNEILNGSSPELKSRDYPILESGPTHNPPCHSLSSYLQPGCLDGLNVSKTLNGPSTATTANLTLGNYRLRSLEKWALLANVGELGKVTPLFAAAALGLTEHTKELLERRGAEANKGP